MNHEDFLQRAIDLAVEGVNSGTGEYLLEQSLSRMVRLLQREATM